MIHHKYIVKMILHLNKVKIKVTKRREVVVSK